MAKSKKAKPKSTRTPEQLAAARKLMFNLSLGLILVGSLTVAYAYTKRYVERDVIAAHEPPVVVLKNRPAWMSDFLADSIATSVRPDIARSPLDHQLLVDAVDALKTNAWIKNIRQIRRAYTNAPGDTIEVDCDYHEPVAIVKANGFFTFVDDGGVVLPERFTA